MQVYGSWAEMVEEQCRTCEASAAGSPNTCTRLLQYLKRLYVIVRSQPLVDLRNAPPFFQTRTPPLAKQSPMLLESTSGILSFRAGILRWLEEDVLTEFSERTAKQNAGSLLNWGLLRQ